MSRKAILVGGFHEIIELCEHCDVEIVGIIDNILKDQHLGYRILSDDDGAKNLLGDYESIPVIISPDSPDTRHRLTRFYSELGFEITGLISPDARISKSAKIGSCTIIQQGAHLSANVTIGNYVKINVFANIMHDSKIGDFTTIAPNAVVLGRVTIAEQCYVGANATILPGKTIANNSVVGAGAVVTKDVPANLTVFGYSAETIKGE